MGRILEDAEKAFLKQCAEAKRAAVEAAAKEIQKDFKKKVFDQAVTDYYADFRPRKYRRHQYPNGLYKAFRVNTTTDGRRISLSYDWDFNRLPQYKSKSKYHKSGSEWISRDDPRFNWDEDEEGNPVGNNGIPEKGWIFTNFMEGIHPKFYLDKELDIVVDASEDFEPSYLRIRQYKEDYINNGDAKDILIKHLKKQYKKYV
jgi:hypothetical protein